MNELLLRRMGNVTCLSVLVFFISAGTTNVAVAGDTSTRAVISGEVILDRNKEYKDLFIFVKEVNERISPPDGPAEIDQKHMAFVPGVLPVVKGTTVKFVNSDNVAHNVFSPEGDYNLGTWSAGEYRKRVFDNEGVYTQLCLVHPEMEGFILVLQNPYYARITDAHRFTLPSLDPGIYRLKLWSPKLKKKSLKRSFKITLKPGENRDVTLNLTKKKKTK